eukprot:m.236775 g.236775  ORF g.236775 m.236775 type:complete len:336 (-) comp13025_c0_seq1:389-1396(-)
MEPTSPAPSNAEPTDASLHSRVSLLGRAFFFSRERPAEVEAFKKQFASLIWFSYRRGFPRIGSTSYQSDSGWGCMLRCGQMILANALLRAQSYPGSNIDVLREQIIVNFTDIPESPFSIQQIAMRGSIVDKPIGAWFGPNAAAQVIKSLVQDSPETKLVVHVAMDGCLATASVEDALAKGPPSWPLLLLVPLRLGLQNLNPEYFPMLLDMLQLPHSIGAVGGRPNAAHYFVGTQDEDLIYLDPHVTQPAAPPGQLLQTYSCTTPYRMRLAQVDPSLCLGFLCSSVEDWQALAARLKEMCSSSPRLFDVVEHPPHLDDADDFTMTDDDDDGFAVVG